ncbi:MAG: carboxyl transferase domain-containing protein [Acidimicrobiales bacterium]
MPLPSRVLIANRGEIAIRVAKAAAGLGIESVGVHAPVDALSLHTRYPMTSVELSDPSGGRDPVAAYLDIEAIVAAAVDSGCDAVHPGYGFLAENSRLPERCAAAGLTFIGPSAEVLALFGDKTRARQLAASLDIPIAAGTGGPLASLDEARRAGADIGYPVMLKAAAGGGGRGMRAVTDEAGLDEAFDRCRREAEAAFGDGAVFAEKLLVRPRHIEVQVIGDRTGAVTHLWERDCSIQLRNQKVVEVAPAPGLDEELRRRMVDDATRLVAPTGFTGVGTVEFLVVPEDGTHHFIECNPRIQVEHTVTEQVTGVDLVETQFHVAGGATLAGLGLDEAPPPPRRFAIQARVVVSGTGTITAYKEPSGSGIRVDGAGYVGYTSPPQFDPLLAKVVVTAPASPSNGASAFAAAVDRTARALQEFHLAGVTTNLAQLRSILADPDVRAGDARTTLLAERPGLLAPAATTATGPAQLLERQAATLVRAGAGSAAVASPGGVATGLAVADGDRAVTSPTAGLVVDVPARAGSRVAAGDPLVVLSAMKMETVLVAPCAGTVTAVGDLDPGDAVDAGQVVVTLEPSADAGAGEHREDGWAPVLAEVATLRRLADERLAPHSDEPGVVRQRNRGKLTCRERIALLVDDGSFHEVGSLAGFASHDGDGGIDAFTPANHVGGWGTIEGRTGIVCADDFTSSGGHADGAIGAKSFYLDCLSMELGVPSVRLLDGSSGGGSVAAMVPEQRKKGESTAKESSGAISAGKPRVAGGGGSFLPGHLGSTEYARQLAEVPVVNLLLGSVVGIGAAKAVLGHFSVMVRDIAQLFVAGPPVVSHAMGYEITKEELGDWRIHCRNGSVDNLADSEQEAFEMTRRFLSYLPSNVHEAPPILPSRTDDPADRRDEELAHLIPRKRTTTFDVRRAIELMADRGSFFEIGSLWGTDQVVGFARFDGHPVGVIASDSMHVNGGALTADGCDKLTRHLDLCDLFHLPVLNLCDNPGFAVGVEHEAAGTIRKGGEWMVAFAQTSVPIFTVLMRRSFGVAGNNYATPRRQPSMRVVWPAADVGGIPPEGGIEAAYKRQLAEAADPVAFRAELEARIESARGPIGPLNRFQMEEMIDPRHTRAYICNWVAGAHRLATQPQRLGPRPLRFRP